MYKKITKYEFIEEFEKWGKGKAYTKEAFYALYDYLISLQEMGAGDDVLNVNDIYYSFTEYTLSEALDDFCVYDLVELKKHEVVIEVNKDKILIHH